MSMKERVMKDKMLLKEIDPRRVINLKKYYKINKDLFDFRRFIKNIKICIITRAYSAYNKIRSEKGYETQKLAVFTRAFRLPENVHLK